MSKASTACPIPPTPTGSTVLPFASLTNPTASVQPKPLPSQVFASCLPLQQGLGYYRFACTITETPLGDLLVTLVPLAIVSGLIGAAILSSLDRGGYGFWTGLFLGPFGWLLAVTKRRELIYERDHRSQKPKVSVAAPSARDEVACPFCAEQVLRAARVCKHCGRDIVHSRG